MQIVPRDGRNEFVLPAMHEHFGHDPETVAILEFVRSNGDLKLDLRRWITRERRDLLKNRWRYAAEISRGAHPPGTESSIGMREHLQMKRRIKLAAPDERPQRVQSCLAPNVRSSRGNEALIIA